MGRLTAGILAGFLLFPQISYAQAPAAAQNAVRETLANGMKVVVLPDDLAPVATTVMTYGVGSDDDSMPGIAHATEHMMLRGTAGVSAAQLAIMAARTGADYNAATSNTNTQYYFKFPTLRAQKICDVDRWYEQAKRLQVACKCLPWFPRAA